MGDFRGEFYLVFQKINKKESISITKCSFSYILKVF